MTYDILTQRRINLAKITKPYFRTCRELIGGGYSHNNFTAYIRDPKYADDPASDIRSYYIIQEVYIEILEYIEPSDDNRKVYSLRLRNLLIMICTEIESHLKAILLANGYTAPKNKPQSHWSMADYSKVNQSHFLDRYVITLPHWKGAQNKRIPFRSWKQGKQLPWYVAYNNCKHSRAENLHYATLDNVTEAMAALIAVLSSQYHLETFNGPEFYEISRGGDTRYAIGNYFGIKFPTLPYSERYNLSIEYTQDEVEHDYQQFMYK